MLQAVAGLAHSQPTTAAQPSAVDTISNSKPRSAYLPPQPILRPATALDAVPQPLQYHKNTHDLPVALLRPKTSPAGGGIWAPGAQITPPADTADILCIEHLPEWQAIVASWHRYADKGVAQPSKGTIPAVKGKPSSKVPPQMRWKSAGARVSTMLASDNNEIQDAQATCMSAEQELPVCTSTSTLIARWYSLQAC